jgi:hypothetical protein
MSDIPRVRVELFAKGQNCLITPTFIIEELHEIPFG